MERLKELLLQKEEYYNNVDLSEDEYYALIETIDNIIVNEFTVEEIDQAKKELNIQSFYLLLNGNQKRFKYNGSWYRAEWA